MKKQLPPLAGIDNLSLPSLPLLSGFRRYKLQVSSIGPLSVDDELTQPSHFALRYVLLAALLFILVTPVMAQSPGGVADQMALWLRADAGVEASPGNGAADGDAVNNWVDQSGARTNDAVSSAPPTYRNNSTNNINHNPIVEFDGIDDGLNFGDDYIYSSGTGNEDGLTFFAIVKPDLTASKPEQYVFQFGTYNDGYTGGLSDDAGRLYSNDQQIYINNTRGYGPNNTSPTLIRYTWDFDNTYQAIHLNGQTTPITDATNNSTQYTAAEIDENDNHKLGSGPFAIGRQTYTATITKDNGRFLQGDIAEIIGYTKDVTPAEFIKIESYLAMKYGLTLDNTGGGIAGDYQASDGTIIWDASTNAAYHKDVITIGRDDLSALSQKQSQTIYDSLKVFVGTLATDNLSNTGNITNARSFITIGHNGMRLLGGNGEVPPGIVIRFQRVWKVVNTNFTDDFSMQIKWEEAAPFDIKDIRLLVDDDGDFSDATIFNDGDNGLTITSSSILVGGISNVHIPANSTRYVTIASTSLDTPLPVELISFDAQANQDEHVVELSWATASEIDNDFFTIEKSQNNDRWTVAEIVPGAGNSSQPLNYHVVDRDPHPGVSYYRLKQTDFDGASSYSDIVAVTIGDFNKQIALFPNPSQTFVTLTGAPSELDGMRILDALGKDVTSAAKLLDGGGNWKRIDVSALPDALYHIVTDLQSMKFIKN